MDECWMEGNYEFKWQDTEGLLPLIVGMEDEGGKCFYYHFHIVILYKQFLFLFCTFKLDTKVYIMLLYCWLWNFYLEVILGLVQNQGLDRGVVAGHVLTGDARPATADPDPTVRAQEVVRVLVPSLRSVPTVNLVPVQNLK